MQEAMLLAKKGFHVFPVTPKQKTPPLIVDFPNRASTSPEQIFLWWSQHPEANIGISTSKFKESEALLVVDIDQKEGKMGEDEFFRLENVQGLEFPTTAEQRTPSGGRHLIYRTPIGVKQGVNVLAMHIDIRSQGGYILGSGSVLESGTYVLGDGEVVQAPEWLVSRCGRSNPKSDSPSKPAAPNINQDYAEERARDYLKTHAPRSIKGSGGDHTAYVVAARVKDFGVSLEKCHELMLDSEWNNESPPGWSAEKLLRKVQNAYGYGINQTGASAPEADFEAIKDETPKKRGIQILPFNEIKVKLDQRYLVDKLLSPGAMSMIYGDSNSKKTFFALDLALHISLGREWMGRKTEQGLVIYVATEGHFGLPPRIEAFKKYHNITENLPFGLCLYAINLWNSSTDIKELIVEIRKIETMYNQKAKLIVIDTLFRALAGGDENSGKDMGAFVNNCSSLKDQLSSHLLLIHHTGKNKEGARGHSSLRAAVDTEIEIVNDVAKIKKQRDMEFCRPFGFKLQDVEIGKNKEDGTVKNAVVLPSNMAVMKDFSKKAINPNSLEEKAVVALFEAMEWRCYDAPEELGLSEGSKMAEIEDFKQKFIELHYSQSPRTTQLSAFTRAVKALIAADRISKNDNYVWLTE